MRTIAVLIVALAAAACTVGPNYKRPIVALSDTYRGETREGLAPADASSLAAEPWWDVFQDDQLRGLIRAALQQNFDLRIAAARILQAQGQLGIVRADQFPTADAGAGAGRERFPESLGLPAGQTGEFQVTASTRWELDFWGKFRRATEAARAVLLASEWGRRSVVTSLVSEVAGAYFQVRALDMELDIAKRTFTSRQESLRLTQLRAQGGATSLVDVRQAEQLVFGAAASIADLERQVEQQENFISVLLGNNPSDVPRGRSLDDQPHLPSVPVGLPSALLERRPDIRQAEERLVASNADIGVANSAYFPQISLTGAGGFQSAALSHQFTVSAGLWSVGVRLAQLTFTAARTRSQAQLAAAQRE